MNDGPTFRESILPALSAVDSIIAALDLAPMQVERVIRRWSGGQRRRGSFGDETLELPEWTLVHEVTAREVASSGGRFEMGTLKVGPIRPYFTEGCCDGDTTPGGFTKEQLDPVVTEEGVEVFYRLTKTHSMGTGESGHYRLVHLHNEDPLAFFAFVVRIEQPSDDLPVVELPAPR